MYYYILNPAAGNGRVNQLQDKIRAKVNTLGIGGEFAKTTGPGDAAKMASAAEAKGYKTIVAIGGDGTVNEVINGLSEDSVAVGVIPIGASNQVANRFGIHDWQQACAILASRRLTNLRLIAAGKNYFLSTLTLGFETDLDKRIDPPPKKLTNRLRQFQKGYGHARDFHSLHCTIKVDDAFEMEANIFTLSITNLKFLNPAADNRLIVSLSERPATPQMTAMVWGLVRKQAVVDDSATTRFTGERLLVDTDPVTGITVDGKVAGRTPIAIRLTDRILRFITEKATTGFETPSTEAKPVRLLD